VNLCVVTGGGNTLRKTDFMLGREGQLPPELQEQVDAVARWGTVENARMMAMALTARGVPNQVLLAAGMAQEDGTLGKSQPNTLENRLTAYEQGKIVVVGGGTGHNNCTTDAAVVAVAEEQAWYELEEANGDPRAATPSWALKATKVHKVLNRDPRRQPAHPDEPLIAYDVIDARHMLESPADYGVRPEDLAERPDMFGVVDRETVDLLANSAVGVTLNVYNGEEHTPLQALDALMRREPLGTLILSAALAQTSL
jgi:uridylate kinase